MKHFCVFLIRLYQKYLSPLKRSPCCRFTPSCSAYAVEAFMKRGFFVGFALTIYRILRCNPFCPGGYDPVPEKKPRCRRDKHKDHSEGEEIGGQDCHKNCDCHGESSAKE